MADLSLRPEIVEEHVRTLNRQADSLGFAGVVLGLAAGAAIGGMPLVTHGPIPSKFGIATLLLGALLAGVLGHILGKARAFGYRLRAEQALGQLRLQQNVEALLALSEHGTPVQAAAPPVEVEPTFDWPEHEPEPELAPLPAIEVEEVVPEPEPEPEPEPDLLPAAWAAVLEHALSPVETEPAPAPTFEAEPAFQPTFAPEPLPEPLTEPEHDPAPAWALPPRGEPAVTLARFGEPVEVAPAATESIAPEPEPVVAAAATSAPIAAEVSHPGFGPTTPTWSVPALVPQPAPEPEPVATTAAPEPEPAAEHAPEPAPDISTMSIAEIARLADAGSL